MRVDLDIWRSEEGGFLRWKVVTHDGTEPKEGTRPKEMAEAVVLAGILYGSTELHVFKHGG